MNRKVIIKKLDVISKCTMCDAPIYGLKQIAENEEPIIKRTCACQPRYPFTWSYPINPVIPYNPYIPYTNPIWGVGGTITIGGSSPIFGGSTINCHTITDDLQSSSHQQ